MYEGRAAEIKKAENRVARILGQKLMEDIHLVTEEETTRKADASLTAARLFRLGRGPRK